jgi:hypothetical protein
MLGINPGIWDLALQELWSRIGNHRLEAEDALDFTRRLARAIMIGLENSPARRSWNTAAFDSLP